jgi:hypothetical protein
MKKIILMLLASLMASLSYAQKIHEKDVPVTVKEAFKKQYPAAKEVKWENESGNYEAEFEMGEIESSVLIDEKGTILETEVEIALDKLPAGVMNYVKTNYAGQKVKEAAKIIDSKGAVTYEVEIEGKDVIFDSNGKFVKEIKD